MWCSGPDVEASTKRKQLDCKVLNLMDRSSVADDDLCVAVMRPGSEFRDSRKYWAPLNCRVVASVDNTYMYVSKLQCK